MASEGINNARSVAVVLSASIALSLYTSAYTHALVPIFARAPTEKFVTIAVHAVAGMSLLVKTRLSRTTSLFLLGLSVLATPHTLYWVGSYAARFKDPLLGPVLTHLVILCPVAYLSLSLVLKVDPQIALMVMTANSPQVRPLVEYLSKQFFINTAEDVSFVYLALIPITAWAWSQLEAGTPTATAKSTGLTPSSIIKVAPVVSAVFVMLSYPHLQSPTLYPLSQPWQSDKYPLTILSSVQSTTGVIVVGDILPSAEGETRSLRYLRASHSLIGGVWLDDKVVTLEGVASLAKDKSGTLLGDPIYSAFVLQEAARLVSSTPQGKSGEWNSALVIGLGAGASASALVQHGIPTTIVEIDPAVYDAARQYFGLPEFAPERVFLEDARNWAQERHRLAMPDPAIEVAPVEVDVFDIIIHDCFSGGSVPDHLYSLQFWEDLKVSLSPGGIVAVNFVGPLASDASKGVTTTLLKAFGQCRAFHDSLTPLTQEQYKSEIVNMVFFCTPSAEPLEFRPSRGDDYLNSHLRARILSTLETREVNMDKIRGSEAWTEEQEKEYLITDSANKLGDWQQGGAFDHWKLMREVLPDAVWEAY